MIIQVSATFYEYDMGQDGYLSVSEHCGVNKKRVTYGR